MTRDWSKQLDNENCDFAAHVERKRVSSHDKAVDGAVVNLKPCASKTKLNKFITRPWICLLLIYLKR